MRSENTALLSRVIEAAGYKPTGFFDKPPDACLAVVTKDYGNTVVDRLQKAATGLGISIDHHIVKMRHERLHPLGSGFVFFFPHVSGGGFTVPYLVTGGANHDTD